MPIMPVTDTLCISKRHRHRRVADGIPGKTGEQEAAQPFRQAKAEGKGGDAADIVAPQQPGDHCRKAIEKGERERNADHREGQGPGKTVGLDQKRRADPPQAGKEIAEAEPPADGEGRPQTPEQTVGGFAGRAVEQPDQQRKRDETDGEEIVRRLGKNRQRPGEKRHQRAPPTPKQNYPAGQALHA